VWIGAWGPGSDGFAEVLTVSPVPSQPSYFGAVSRQTQLEPPGSTAGDPDAPPGSGGPSPTLCAGVLESESTRTSDGRGYTPEEAEDLTQDFFALLPRSGPPCEGRSPNGAASARFLRARLLPTTSPSGVVGSTPRCGGGRPGSASRSIASEAEGRYARELSP